MMWSVRPERRAGHVDRGGLRNEFDPVESLDELLRRHADPAGRCDRSKVGDAFTVRRRIPIPT